MKKSWIIIGVIVVVVLILIMSISGSYNRLVSGRETVNKSWADVQGAYQRRADLIPNLVSTVKGYAKFEQETMIKVTEARASATRPELNIDPARLNETNLAQFQKAQDELSSSLSRLLVSVEKYPDLKANQNFLALQQQLEGTENRINVERRNFNEKVQLYDTKLLRFPTNIIAGMFGFTKMPYFEAQAGSETAPKVNF
jgi:LemA protein